MTVDTTTFRVRIGTFYSRSLRLPGTKLLSSFDLVVWLAILLSISGDIETNPGPASTTSESSTSYSSIPDFSVFHKHFSVVHYNVQSFLPKAEQLYAELSHFDVLAFSETWLSPSTHSNDILFTDYQIPFRKDRVGDNHGGVLVYVKNNIPAKRRVDLEPAGVECIWVELTLNAKKILLGAFYRPPNSTPNILGNIQTSIDLALDTRIADIILTGDLNLNQLADSSRHKLDDILRPYSMSQIIEEPTHYTEHSSSLLDVFCVKKPDTVLKSGVGEAFLNLNVRYHCPIFCLFTFKKPKPSSYKRRIWQYDLGNYAGMSQTLGETDWNALFTDDINIYANNIADRILDSAGKFIPNKTVLIRPDEPSWLSSSVKRLIRKRRRAHRKAKQTNSAAHWSTYRRLRNVATDALKRSKQIYYEALATKLKTDKLTSRDWWKTFKSFISPSSSSSIPPLNHEGHILTDGQDKADAFNTFFRNQTILDDSNSSLPSLPAYNGPKTSDIVLTPDEVGLMIRTLPTGKASGPDSINNRVLKEMSVPLSAPLCTLFNYSISSGQVPQAWKEANVTPVLKKDDPSAVTNYRPISLLSAIGKLLEKLIHKHIYNFFLENNVITAFQSGFVRGDSTVNQLTDMYNVFCKALDAGKEVRAVFCDISKAFDRVWHKGLLFKLEHVGISGHLLAWFNSYLSGRKQRVVLPGTSSSWVPINAGVPQGSILGPLLFLVFINDIVSVTHSPIRLFADDTSLYLIVDDPQSAGTQLNNDIQAIHTWAKSWLVTFNPSKTESLLLTRKVSQIDHPQLQMDHVAIQEVSTHKHLGVFFSKSRDWHNHIDYITSKALQRINIMRKFKFILDRTSLEKMYFVFIRPILEYADVVWDNCTLYDKNELEKVQLEAARIATGSTKLVSIEALYRETGWEPLSVRRRKHKLTTFFKMTHNLAPNYLCNLVPHRVGHNATYNLRNSDDFLQVKCNTKLYSDSFLPSVIKDWNSLPASTRSTDSIGDFKRQLNVDNPPPPPSYYSIGERYAQVQHTRLRTGASALNSHLHARNLIGSPNCDCGLVENTSHYLLHCPRFTEIRGDLRDASFRHFGGFSEHHLLNGNPDALFEDNVAVFKAVQDFIVRSKRFG